MAFSQSQHDALEAAIAEGARIVEYEDRKVEYRSLKDMLALLGKMEKDLGLTNRKPNRVRVETSKGLGNVPPMTGTFGT